MPELSSVLVILFLRAGWLGKVYIPTSVAMKPRLRWGTRCFDPTALNRDMGYSECALTPGGRHFVLFWTLRVKADLGRLVA
jgi:hypothetical protein